MQPNEQPVHPIDYLDSISSVPRGATTKTNDRLFFGAIIAAVATVLLVGLFAFFALRDNSAEQLSVLSVRLTNLQKISDANQKHLVGSRIRSTNSGLNLVLTNAERDLSPHLLAHEVDSRKISAKIVAQENTDELAERLEDARLNGILDRIYAREMAYELETLMILIQQLESKTKNGPQKEYLKTTYNNIKPIQESFSKFNASTN